VSESDEHGERPCNVLPFRAVADRDGARLFENADSLSCDREDIRTPSASNDIACPAECCDFRHAAQCRTFIMSHPIDPIEEMLWAYIRGDIEEAAFEAWLYATPDLDNALGSEDYSALVTSDYRDVSAHARHDRLKKAREVVGRRFPRRCVCLSVPNAAIRNISGPSIVEAQADVVARRTPWIELAHCRDCGTDWLIGTDSVDDDYYLHRLTAEAASNILAHDRWPAVFDDRAALWPDDKWLKAFEFDSLDAWRAAHDPSRRQRP
jgi:hypothetical protein